MLHLDLWVLLQQLYLIGQSTLRCQVHTVEPTDSSTRPIALNRITLTTKISPISSFSKTFLKSNWSLILCNSMVTKRVIILKIASSCIRCWDSTINLSDQCLRLQGSQQPSLMSGTFCGLHPAAKVICMKVLTNIRKLIIFPKVMKSPGKIDSALTSLECRRDSESNIMISFQILISYLTSLENFMSTTKS